MTSLAPQPPPTPSTSTVRMACARTTSKLCFTDKAPDIGNILRLLAKPFFVCKSDVILLAVDFL